MDFCTSSQRLAWQQPRGFQHCKETQDCIKSLVEFLVEVESKCGLGHQRRALVTAAHYLHRLCLVAALPSADSAFKMEDPKLVALVCLFIAGKVEELRWESARHGTLQNRGFQAEQLLKHLSPDFTQTRFMECEELVLDTLDFQFIVHQTVPKPEENSVEERRETWLLANTAECLCNSPQEFGLLVWEAPVAAEEQSIN